MQVRAVKIWPVAADTANITAHKYNSQIDFTQSTRYSFRGAEKRDNQNKRWKSCEAGNVMRLIVLPLSKPPDVISIKLQPSGWFKKKQLLNYIHSYKKKKNSWAETWEQNQDRQMLTWHECVCKWFLRRNTKFILLLWYVFLFFPNSRIAVHVKEGSNWARRCGQGVKGYLYPRPPSGPAAAWKIARGEDMRAAAVSLPRSAEPRQKPKPSSPNGLRLSGVFPLLLSPLEWASQSRHINPGSRTWGLVRDTARLEETEDVSWIMEKTKVQQ